MSYDKGDDLATLLQNMGFAIDSEKLQKREKTPWTMESLKTAKTTETAASVQANSQSVDLEFISQNMTFLSGIFPYKEKQHPISNGNCNHVQASGDYATSTFADCVETALRHIVNLIIFDGKNRRFTVPDHLKNTPLAAFYERQTPELANGGDTHVPFGTRLWLDKTTLFITIYYPVMLVHLTI